MKNLLLALATLFMSLTFIDAVILLQLEPGPSVAALVFLFIGTGCWLEYKARR